jgi:hypothetical protein
VNSQFLEGRDTVRQNSFAAGFINRRDARIQHDAPESALARRDRRREPRGPCPDNDHIFAHTHLGNHLGTGVPSHQMPVCPA